MKKLITLLLCIQFAFAVSATPWDGTTAGAFAGGAGTAGDPYQIATAEQLSYLASLANAVQTANVNTAGKYYKLTADIDLNGPTYAWIPIGTATTTAFAGIFDGDNHIISNLYISSSAVNQGLFGYVVGTSSANPSAMVKNITIASGSILTTANYAAAVAARCQYAQISNCKNAIPVTGLAYSGGIVGRADGVSIIDGCGNTGVIKSTAVSSSYTAGIVASFQALTTNGVSDISYVRSCYNRGSVNAASYSGGIVGSGFGYLTIDKCFNTAAITVTTGGSGGIIGYGYTSSNGVLNISNCYNTGAVKASAAVSATNCAGGILGYVGSVNTRYFGTISNCYNTGTIAGNVKEPIAGQLTGATGGGIGTVTNSYFLASSGTNTISNDGTSVADAATLQGYAATLNNSQDPAVWSADVTPNFNGGYPILSWVSALTKLTAPSPQTPTNITSTSFTANWTPVANAIGYYVILYTNVATPVYITSQYVSGQATSSLLFSGLTSDVSCVYKVIAVSPSGTTYIDSEESASFIAGLGGATVLTSSFAQASATSVTINCNIPVYSVGAVTARGICYSTGTQSPTILNTLVTDVAGGNGDYTVTMGSLLENTSYFFRAYATTAARTNYSVTGVFKILSKPVVSDATAITATGFTANWTAVANASSYDVKVYQGATLISTTNASGQSAASVAITGLTSDLVYTYTVTAIGNGSTTFSSSASLSSNEVTLSIATALQTATKRAAIIVTGKSIQFSAVGNIQICSITGAQVASVENADRIDTMLPAGVYIVHFTQNGGAQASYKVVLR